MEKLQIIDKGLIAEIEKNWEEQLAEYDVNPARCRGAIARAKEILSGGDSQQYVYAYVYIGTTGSFDGLALLSHALPKSTSPWLKVLELTLAPGFINVDNPAPLDELIKIAASVVTEVFELTSDRHKSSSVKIYGDSVMDVRIWKSVAQKLQGNVNMPFDTSSHGRWLVLERNGE